MDRVKVLKDVAALLPALYGLVDAVADAVRKGGDEGARVTPAERAEIAVAAQRFLEKVVEVVTA